MSPKTLGRAAYCRITARIAFGPVCVGSARVIDTGHQTRRGSSSSPLRKPCLSSSPKATSGRKPHSFSPLTSPRGSGMNTPSTSNSRTSSRHTRTSTAASRTLYSARLRHTGRRCASYVRRGATQASQLRAPRRCSACPAPSTSRTASTRARTPSCTTSARRSSSRAGSTSKRSARPRQPCGRSPTRT